MLEGSLHLPEYGDRHPLTFQKDRDTMNTKAVYDVLIMLLSGDPPMVAVQRPVCQDDMPSLARPPSTSGRAPKSGDRNTQKEEARSYLISTRHIEQSTETHEMPKAEGKGLILVCANHPKRKANAALSYVG